MADSTHTPAEPRLGAALIIGADAAICVHVHTDPAGIAAVRARLDELDTSPREDTVPVVAVLGEIGTDLADRYEVDVPAAAVDDLAAFVLGLNRPAVDR